MKSDWAELEVKDWPIRVLHVDAVAECLEAMREILHDPECYELISTDSGNEAIGIIAGPNTPPDILITDIKLGDYSGYEVVWWIKSFHETAHIPCMVITGNYEANFLEKMFEYGVECCLPKPCGRSKVEARITDMVAQHVLPRRKQILAEARGAPPKPWNSEPEPLTIGQRLALLDIPPESRIDPALRQSRADLELWDRPIRILHADDHPSILQEVQDVLGDRSAYELTSVDGGFEALSVAFDSEEPPEILITDVKMPDLDGIALAQFLKEDPRTAHIPCMFLTGHHETRILLHLFAMGADHCLPKPFKRIDMQARVLEIVARDVLPRRRQLRDASH